MNNIDLMEQQVIAARKNISTDDQILLNDYVSTNSASPAVAWILWIFFGQLGVHRFYLKRNYAVLMLVLEIIGWLTAIIVIGFGFLAAVSIWWIVDAFSIQKWIKENKIQTALRGIQTVTGKSVESLSGMSVTTVDGNSFVNYSQSSQPTQSTDDTTDFSKPNE